MTDEERPDAASDHNHGRIDQVDLQGHHRVHIAGRRDGGRQGHHGAGGTVGDSIRSTARNAGRHLKDPVLLTLYLQPFLLMGGFVALYNYLGYHLTDDPFLLPVWITSLVFLAYLAGTVTSPIAGRLAGRYGRKIVMLVSDAIALASLALLLIPSIWMNTKQF